MFRKKEQEKQAKMEEESEEDLQERVIITEERFMNLLSPMESQIMSLQSLLVWEKPEQSAALLLGVNVLFWLATTIRIYYLIGMTGVVLTFADLWRNYIWPEIRVPPPPGDNEEWIPVHPKMLSVPELAHYAAEAWVTVSHVFESAAQLRRRHHAKFFIKSLLLCLCLAVFGHYVPGIYLSYFTVMACILAPCAWYHSLVSRGYTFLEPYIRNFEGKMKIKRTRSRKGKKKKKKSREMPAVEQEDSLFESETDEEEEELAAFVPAEDPLLSARLERAITDSEDSEDSGTHDPPSGITSPQDSLLGESEDMSFTPRLSEMPSMDQVDASLTDMRSLADLQTEIDRQMEDSHDDLDDTLEDDDLPRSDVEDAAAAAEAPTVQDDINFVSGHFKESSEEEEEKATENIEHQLAEGLEFPEFEEAAQAEEQEAPSTQARILQSALENSQVVTQTVSSLMSSTMSGLSSLRETVMAARGGASEAAAVAPTAAGRPEAEADVVDAEFEFLSQEELEDSIHEEGIEEEEKKD